MTFATPPRFIIAEDSWVGVAEFGARRMHKVFATNGDVLTYCNRWLKRDTVRVLSQLPQIHRRCQLCEKAAKA